MITLTYETPRAAEASLALRRLTLFIFLMCLVRAAANVIWPVNLWRLPPFRPSDLATGINWWSWIEPKTELAARALLCIAAGWFLLRPRRAWKFLTWSAIAFCVVVGSGHLLKCAASVAHHLGYLEGLSGYYTSRLGLPGLLVSAATGLVWACGAMLVLLGLMRAAGRTSAGLSWRRVQWIACAVLVPFCLWSFMGCLDDQSRAAIAKRFRYLMSARWSIATLGTVGDTLDFPILCWINLPTAIAAAIALATNLRWRRPLRIALWSVVAILLTSNALLALVAVAEHAGWSYSNRFGVWGDLPNAIHWISNFASSALYRSAYFVACAIALRAEEN